MVRQIPTISPSQLLALKALDPLQQQEEHGEHQDGQPDISQILHKRLLRRTSTGLVNRPACGAYRSLTASMQRT